MIVDVEVPVTSSRDTLPTKLQQLRLMALRTEHAIRIGSPDSAEFSKQTTRMVKDIIVFTTS